jgi:hypothetical protein
MINPQEIFILIVSSGALLLVLLLHRRLVLIASWKWLMASFLLYYFSTVLTVVEGFLLPDVINFLEHLSRALFPLPVLFWVRSQAGARRMVQRPP